MDHAYADVNGIRLHYVTVGRGPLILFVHAFPEFWYEWRRQLAEFGRDHQAVAPDMRGYNLSEKPAELSQYRVPHMVEDLRALAEHLGRERFVLVGHDFNRLIRSFLGPGQVLFTYLHLAPAPELTRALRDSGAIAIAYETVQRADGSLPLLTPMSEVAGRLSVQEGAFYLGRAHGGRGILLSGVPGVP